MKLKKRKTSKVWKEVLETVEAFKDNPEYAPDPDHVQLYITTNDGGIVELTILLGVCSRPNVQRALALARSYSSSVTPIRVSGQSNR